MTLDPRLRGVSGVCHHSLQSDNDEVRNFGPGSPLSWGRTAWGRDKSKWNLVVHVVVLAARGGHCRLALTRCRRPGRAEIAVVRARTTACAIEHRQRGVKALQHHLGRIAVLPVFILPFACLQSAFEINLRALLQVLLRDLGKAFAEDDDAMPFGFLAPLA